MFKFSPSFVVTLRYYTIIATVVAGLFVLVLGYIFIHDAIYDAIDYGRLLEELPSWMRYRFVIGLVGLGGLLIGAGVVLLPWALQMQTAEIAYDTEHGQIRVSAHSITELLRQHAHEIKGIHDLRAEVNERHGEVTVEIKAGVDVGRPIPELMVDLQNFVREALVKTLGLPNVKQVNVSLNRLLGDKKTSLAPDALRTSCPALPAPQSEPSRSEDIAPIASQPDAQPSDDELFSDDEENWSDVQPAPENSTPETKENSVWENTPLDEKHADEPTEPSEATPEESTDQEDDASSSKPTWI